MLLSRLSTLRARLIFLVLAAVVPISAAILYAGHEQRRQALEQVEREALFVAGGAAATEDRIVLETRQLLSVLAHVPAVQQPESPDCGAFLDGVRSTGSRYANLGVIGTDGLVQCSAVPFTPPLDVSHRDYYQRVLRTREFAISGYQVGLITGRASVNFGFPLATPTGELRGVVFAAVPLDWLRESLAEAELPPGSEVLVTDATATMLAHFPEEAIPFGASLADSPLGRTILMDDRPPIVEARGADGVRRMYATTMLQDVPQESPVFVTVGIPIDVAYAPVNLAIARNLSLLGAALILVIWMTWWTSGSLVLRPVRKLVHATHELSAGDLQTRVAIAGAPREIEALTSAFNEMAGTLQTRMHEIRQHVVQIDRLSRVRAVLSGINSAILRIRDREELLQEACRISVELGEFTLAWVGEPDPESEGIRVAAIAARDHPISGSELPAVYLEPGGLAARALEGGREVVSNDLADRFPHAPPERDPGYRSAAAIPLRIEDRVVASLNLYTTEAEFFTEEEIRLMRELAADTSLGLEYVEKEQQLHYLANFDPLTGLPNRSLFTDHLHHALGRAREQGKLTGLLLVGIKGMSEINATLGHRVGDVVLQRVAEHLGEVAGAANPVARLGSRDFGVIIPEVATIRPIERMAHQLVERMPHEIEVETERVFPSVRVGIAVFPHDGSDPDALIQAATLALEVAGSSSARPVAFHSVELDSEAQQRRRLEQELRGAVLRRELALFYQPVVDLATGAPLGMEALVRWQSPELGDVSPGVFIPLAEELGVISEIGEWVIATAAKEARRLHDEGLTDLRMNVNVSVSQIRDPDFVRRFTRIIEEQGVDLDRLGIGIEITESELMENIQDALTALNVFREMGLWIYIDDFGTGYSSLSYLRSLPLNSLKIDHSFIRDLPGDRDAVAIVRSIIALAKSLDLRVIAEGVETEEQLAVLQELGCDAGQGFLFSRPVLADQLEVFLSGRA